MAWRVEVDTDKCTGDEECVNVCPVAFSRCRKAKRPPSMRMSAWAVRVASRFAPRELLPSPKPKAFIAHSKKTPAWAQAGVFLC